MSTEEKKTQTGAKSPAKRKKTIFSRIAKWFREMKSELKKVIWPTPKQILNNTIVALVMMLVCAVVIWGFDEIASLGVQALIAIGG